VGLCLCLLKKLNLCTPAAATSVTSIKSIPLSSIPSRSQGTLSIFEHSLTTVFASRILLVRRAQALLYRARSCYRSLSFVNCCISGGLLFHSLQKSSSADASTAGHHHHHPPSISSGSQAWFICRKSSLECRRTCPCASNPPSSNTASSSLIIPLAATANEEVVHNV